MPEEQPCSEEVPNLNIALTPLLGRPDNLFTPAWIRWSCLRRMHTQKKMRHEGKGSVALHVEEHSCLLASNSCGFLCFLDAFVRFQSVPLRFLETDKKVVCKIFVAQWPDLKDCVVFRDETCRVYLRGKRVVS